MSIALSALRTYKQAIDVSSSNINNVNTQGYTKLTSQIEQLQYGGVNFLEPRAKLPEALFQATLSSMSKFSYDSSLSKQRQAIASAFGDLQKTPILKTMADFEKVLTSSKLLSNTTGKKQGIINAISNIINKFDHVRNQIFQLKKVARSELETSLRKVNKLKGNFYDLHKRIKAYPNTDNKPGLQNEERKTLEELSQLLSIKKNNIGSSTVLQNGSKILEKGDDLVFDGQKIIDSDGREVTIKGGKISAIMDMMKEFDHVASKLNRYKTLFINEINAVHNNLYPSTLPIQIESKGKTINGSSNHKFTGSITLHKIDSNGKFLSSQIINLGKIGKTYNDLIKNINGPGLSSKIDSNGKLIIKETNGNAPLIDASNSKHATTGRNFNVELGINNLLDSHGKIIIKNPSFLSLSKINSAMKSFGPTSEGVELFKSAMYKIHDIDGDKTDLYQATVTLAAKVSENAKHSKNNADDSRIHFAYFANRLSAKTKVNLEEEMANIMTYKKSYDASVKLISTLEEMFKNLLAIV